jgi:hypothetical protein
LYLKRSLHDSVLWGNCYNLLTLSDIKSRYAETANKYMTKYSTSLVIKKMQIKIPLRAGCQQLIPVIPATQEAKIRRIVDQSHPRQIVQETLSRKKKNHKHGLVKWLKV